MRQVLMSEEHGNLELDVCRHCLCAWFDPGEYRALPPEPAAFGTRGELPDHPAAREAAAMMDLQLLREHQRREEERSAGIAPWKWIPGLLGMPVEISEPARSSRPWAVWGLSAALVLVFVATMSDLQGFAQAWGFKPAEPSRAAGATVLVSFFLHGGWMHLLSNAYFLLVFGDNVEDRLGRGKLLLLVLGSHLAGALLHAGLEPRGELPLVGASAGISGVIAYYAIAFPRTRLGLLLFFFWWVRLPALTMLVLYTGLQILGAMAQIDGFGGVSNLGHLGGLAVGILAAFVWRGRQAGPRLKRDSYFKDYRAMS
jgi:membrane associated rhomboid family serine protease